MARTAAHVRLKRETAALDPRAVQARLMTGLSLAACGAVFGTLVLMGGTVEREADTLEGAWAQRGVPPAACAEAGLSADAATGMAVGPGEAGCGAMLARPQPAGREAALSAALPAEPSAAPPAAQKPSRRAPRPPTYIRLRKPEPSPDPPQLALEGLRGGL